MREHHGRPEAPGVLLAVWLQGEGVPFQQLQSDASGFRCFSAARHRNAEEKADPRCDAQSLGGMTANPVAGLLVT